MLTIDQINAAHSKVKSGADFPQYIRDLEALGVSRYDMLVEDGLIIYRGPGEFTLQAGPKYKPQAVADTASAGQLQAALTIHQQGQTNYLTFCTQAAEAGVARWTTDVIRKEVAYFDKQGNTVLSEPIP